MRRCDSCRRAAAAPLARPPRLRRLHSDALLRAHESCSDLVQSVCREVLGELDGFEYRGEPAFRSWLYQKALGKVLDRRRYRLAQRRDPAREQPPPSELMAAFCSPSQVAIGREAFEKLQRCFERMPQHCRTVITLAKLVGKSHAEVAVEMQREEGAVRVFSSRCSDPHRGWPGVSTGSLPIEVMVRVGLARPK